MIRVAVKRPFYSQHFKSTESCDVGYLRLTIGGQIIGVKLDLFYLSECVEARPLGALDSSQLSGERVRHVRLAVLDLGQRVTHVAVVAKRLIK